MTNGAGLRVAVDVGGTFTDICILDEGDGSVRVAKVPSTADPLTGVMSGVAEAGIDLSKVALFSHGTTVATNALITRRLPTAAMVTTRGFRDVIEIRRGTKEDLWDAYKDVAPPYVRRLNRLEVTERVDYAGDVFAPLDEDEAREVAERLRQREVATVAVCFVNSYVNPANERRMREILEEELPGVHISTSSEVLPEIFEHERFSTTVANAVLAPLVGDYTRRMGEQLAEAGYAGDLLLLHSGGGVMTPTSAQRLAVRLAASGIAAGAIASRHIATLCGFEHAIGLDMGGTVDRYLARLRRRGAAYQGVVRRVRLSDRLPLDRGADDWRGRRLDRLDRPGGRAPQRAAVRRGGSRARRATAAATSCRRTRTRTSSSAASGTA